MRPKSSEDSDLLTLNCLSQFNFYSTHGFLIQWCTCEIKPDSSVEGVSAGVSPPPSCSFRRELGADLPTSASRSMTRPPSSQAPTRTCLLLCALAPIPHVMWWWLSWGSDCHVVVIVMWWWFSCKIKPGNGDRCWLYRACWWLSCGGGCHVVLIVIGTGCHVVVEVIGNDCPGSGWLLTPQIGSTITLLLYYLLLAIASCIIPPTAVCCEGYYVVCWDCWSSVRLYFLSYFVFNCIAHLAQCTKRSNIAIC